jgi:hypothetical protein
MSHLGSRLSALADGQLPPAVAERALEHVAGCAECAAELRAARAARDALWSADAVAPTPDLTARLLALGGTGRDGDRPDGTRPAGGGAVRARRVADFTGSVALPGHAPLAVPPGCLRGDVTARRLPRAVLAAAAGCVVVFVAGLAVLGGDPAVVPETQRSYALSLLAAAPDAAVGAAALPGAADDATSTRPGAAAQSAGAATTAMRRPEAGSAGLGADAVAALPDQGSADALGPRSVVEDVVLTGPDAHREVLSWMADHGWVSPVSLPATFRVTGLRLDAGGPGSLELDLVGPSGPVVVVQEHGRLHPDALRGVPLEDVGGRSVHVVCNDPWYVVWQSGDSVVTVVADAPTADVRELVAAHPAAEYDDGLGARLSRGWATLTGSWVP